MKLRLSNDTDVQAAATVAGLQHWKSIAHILGEYSLLCPLDEDFEATISKELLRAPSPSYISNPATLALHVFAKVGITFEDCAGYQTPTNTHTITIVMHRSPKPSRRTNPKTTVKSLIKEFLNLNHDTNMVIEIPIQLIPAFILTHPEQLTYAIKRETGTPISIQRTTTNWTISRK